MNTQENPDEQDRFQGSGNTEQSLRQLQPRAVWFDAGQVLQAARRAECAVRPVPGQAPASPAAVNRRWPVLAAFAWGAVVGMLFASLLFVSFSPAGQGARHIENQIAPHGGVVGLTGAGENSKIERPESGSPNDARPIHPGLAIDGNIRKLLDPFSADQGVLPVGYFVFERGSRKGEPIAGGQPDSLASNTVWQPTGVPDSPVSWLRISQELLDGQPEF